MKQLFKKSEIQYLQAKMNFEEIQKKNEILKRVIFFNKKL